MIGIAEIIFSILVFGLLWFLIFKFVLKYNENQRLKNIAEKMEKQDKRFFSDGKEIDLKKELGLKEKEAEEENREDKTKNIKEGFKE